MRQVRTRIGAGCARRGRPARARHPRRASTRCTMRQVFRRIDAMRMVGLPCTPCVCTSFKACVAHPPPRAPRCTPRALGAPTATSVLLPTPEPCLSISRSLDFSSPQSPPRTRAQAPRTAHNTTRSVRSLVRSPVLSFFFPSSSRPHPFLSSSHAHTNTRFLFRDAAPLHCAHSAR